MKKRKILVSLALASACLFSLASCGGDEEPTPTPTTTTVAPAPTTTTTTSSTNSNYEELTSTIDMKVDDIPAGKAAKDIVKGVFTIVQGSELRERTRTWTNPEDSTDQIIFERSIKMGDDTAALKVNVAPGVDRVLSVYVQNGSSSAKTQKIKVTKPDGSTYTIEYAGNDAFGGYPGSSVVVRIDIEVTDGEWKIQRNSGTTDLYAATLTGKFEKSEISGFEIASEGKTEYMVGEDYSSLDVVVNAVYGNGRRDQLARTDYTVDTTGVDMNTAGEYDVKIKYGNYDAKTIKITVTALSTSLELGFNRIEKLANSTAGNGVYFNQTVKRVYKKGEALDTDDLSIKTKSADGKKYFVIDKEDANLSISNVDMSTTGEKTVTVTYELGGTTSTGTFNVYVVDTAPHIVNDIVQVKVDKNYTGEIGAVVGGFNMFSSIQQALDFLENNKDDIAQKQKVLKIAAGKYTEKLEITVPYLTIEGAGAGSTKIEWDSLYGQVDEGGFTHTTDSTQTVAVREAAVNCTITNLTISNYWNNYQVFDEAFGANYGEHRALALLVQSDKFRMTDAKLLGYQDTVEFFTGRQYLKDCYISGTTDFIFGTNNTTLFTNCEIHTIDTGKQKDGALQEAPVDGGYTTAFKGNNKDANDYVDYGAIFYGCTFTADTITAASHNTALGRPWGAYAAVAYINCNLGEHFSTTGYNNSSKNQRYVSMNAAPTDETVKFVEYGNYGAGAVYPAVIEGTTTEKYGAIATGITAGEAVPANKYYEVVMDGLYPKKENGRYVVKLTTDTTFDATKVQNKQYMVEVTVSGYKFLTATDAANYTDFTKIFGETNGGVSYLEAWDPTAEVVIKADTNVYYKFDNVESTTGTGYLLPTTLNMGSSSDEYTLGDLTFNSSKGNIAYNSGATAVNMKTGAKITFHVDAKTKVVVKAYDAGHATFTMNGVATTTDTLTQYYDTATTVELISTSDAYLKSITIISDATAPAAATLKGITLAGIPDEEYLVGADYDISKLVVTALYSDNTKKEVTGFETNAATQINKNAPGTYEVTVTYEGQTATFNVKYVGAISTTINDDLNFIIGKNNSSLNGAATNDKIEGTSVTISKVTIDATASGACLRLNGGTNAQFYIGTRITFTVAAGAIVTVTGDSYKYGYKVNNVTATSRVSTYICSTETPFVIESTDNGGYLDGISVTFPNPTKITSSEEITFGNEGNIASSHAVVVGNVSANGGNSLVTGTVVLSVVAGAKVKVYGYGGSEGSDQGDYTSYTVTANGTTSANQNMDYEVTATSDGLVYITSTGDNYLIKITVTIE